MRLYLAGPMRNYPDNNFPAFALAAGKLRKDGHEVFNPAELGDNASRFCFATEVSYVAEHASGVVVLPGWERSAGALAEVHTAWAVGIPVWRFSDFLKRGERALEVRRDVLYH